MAPWRALNLGMNVDDEWRRVYANRDLAARTVGARAEQLVFGEQVHGRQVAVVTSSPARGRNGSIAGVDALVTATPGLVLAVLAADCLPVLLADPVAGVVGAAHVGRSGLAQGVLAATLEQMAGLGASPDRMSASLGPAACGRCYELPDELADRVGAAAPGSRSTTRQGTASIDLVAGAGAALRAAGVRDVHAVGGCTIEQPERFYSYRRDALTGRHAGLVVLQAA